MSNQTHREPEDLARKRREYLLKYRTMYSSVVILVLIAFFPWSFVDIYAERAACVYLW